eukprot:12444188-Prorocentrum_lima.AAC.1
MLSDIGVSEVAQRNLVPADVNQPPALTGDVVGHPNLLWSLDHSRTGPHRQLPRPRLILSLLAGERSDTGDRMRLGHCRSWDRRRGQG